MKYGKPTTDKTNIRAALPFRVLKMETRMIRRTLPGPHWPEKNFLPSKQRLNSAREGQSPKRTDTKIIVGLEKGCHGGGDRRVGGGM